MTNPHDRETIRAECDRALENGYENILGWTPEQLADDLSFYSSPAENMKRADLIAICKEWLDDKRKDDDDPVGVGSPPVQPPDGSGVHAARVQGDHEPAAEHGQQQSAERFSHTSQGGEGQ